MSAGDPGRGCKEPLSCPQEIWVHVPPWVTLGQVAYILWSCSHLSVGELNCTVSSTLFQFSVAVL